MKVRIADLDFGPLLDRARAHSDAAARTAFDPLITEQMRKAKDARGAIDLVRRALYSAVWTYLGTLEALTLDDPIGEALARAQRHPDASPPFSYAVDGLSGPDMKDRVAALAADPRAPDWDFDAVQALLVRALRTRCPDHVVDDAMLPWKTYWGPGRDLAYPIFEMEVLRAWGLL